MKTVKKTLALALALLMMLTLPACGGSSSNSPSTDAPSSGDSTASKDDAPQADPSLLVVDDSEYATMTEEELYEAALKEYEAGHKLVVYSTTNSTEKSTTKFEEAYPGLVVEATKKKEKDLSTLIPTESKSESAYGDLVIMSDSTGSVYNEWYQKGYVTAYYPPMVNDLHEDYVSYGLPISIECNVWYYNTDVYPDGCPITNWWQLLEKNEDGSSKYKLCSQPTSTLSMASDFCNLVLHGDELAQAYEDLYGEPLEYTYDADELGVEAENAGYEWIYRYLQSDYTLFSDSDEICAYVGSATKDTPIFGFGTGIKLGDAQENGLAVEYITDIAPFSGFAKTKYVYIVNNTDNPAAARLFALFSLGGEDAQGKGYDAYVNRTGCYPTRSSRDELEYNGNHPFATVNSLPTNLEYVYENYVDIQDFFEYYAAVFQ